MINIIFFIKYYLNIKLIFKIIKSNIFIKIKYFF